MMTTARMVSGVRAAVLLAGMAMVAAPIIMPGVARELFGVDPSSPEFRER